jgi:RNA polymerase sigma factor for flagellar operon FliA
MITKDEVPVVWEEFLKSKKGNNRKAGACPIAEKKLIEYYFPLVQQVGQRMHTKIVHLSAEELASMGVFGLYDALYKYDPERKNKFETYAVPRIKGSILDEIRKIDWIPRLVRSTTKKFDDQVQMAQHKVGRKLTAYELAEELNKSEEEINELIDKTNAPVVYSVQEVNHEEENSGLSIDQIEDKSFSLPVNNMIRKEFFQKILGLNFTPQERKIMWLYYFEKRSMKEIAEISNISESRVSQLRTKILNRIKQKAERNPEYFSDIWKEVNYFRGEFVSL